jgi:hypothetical protein
VITLSERNGSACSPGSGVVNKNRNLLVDDEVFIPFCFFVSGTIGEMAAVDFLVLGATDISSRTLLNV